VNLDNSLLRSESADLSRLSRSPKPTSRFSYELDTYKSPKFLLSEKAFKVDMSEEKGIQEDNGNIRDDDQVVLIRSLNGKLWLENCAVSNTIKMKPLQTVNEELI
jgi:hypothetical protein